MRGLLASRYVRTGLCSLCAVFSGCGAEESKLHQETPLGKEATPRSNRDVMEFSSSGGETIDVALRVVDAATDPEEGTLPAGITEVCADQEFFVELWVSQVDGGIEGIAGGSVDLHFDSGLVTASMIDHGGIFDDLISGTIEQGDGRVNDVGGSVLEAGRGVAPDWALFSRIHMFSADEGTPTPFTLEHGAFAFALAGGQPPLDDAVVNISDLADIAVVTCVPDCHIDIKPGTCPNPLNCSSRGVLSVALTGTEIFDVAMIDISSVRLHRADGVGGEIAPNEGPPGPHSVIEDVATPFHGEACDCHDLEGDGIDDLCVKFRTVDVVAGLELEDLDPDSSVRLVVTGTLTDGIEFSASDCVRLTPPFLDWVGGTATPGVPEPYQR